MPGTRPGMTSSIFRYFTRGPMIGARADHWLEALGAFFRHRRNEGLLDAADQRGPFEHEPGIELDERGAGLDLGQRRLGRVDAADADQQQLPVRQLVDSREHPRRAGEERPSRQAAGLLGKTLVAQTLGDESLAGERRVRHDDAVDAVGDDHAHHLWQILLGNIGGELDSKDRIGDYVQGIARMAEVASYFTINISSPNTPGLRDLQAPEALDALLKRVQEARAATRRKPPLLVKLAPDIAEEDLPEVVRVIVSHGVDGIVVSNTTLSREGLVPEGLRDQGFAKEAGGLSGRPLFARATRMLARVYKLTEGKLLLIGVGGIDSPETALAKIEAGASLIQLYTGLVFEGPSLIGRIKRALVEAMEQRGAQSLDLLIGARADEWATKA